jgi:Asp-tRNA(Asn)/Glu-tRNA(Gln) amidotransferase A subunit family amidase
MKLMTSADPWKLDSSVIFSPWRDITPKTTIRLGLIQEDSHFPLHPPVLRSLTTATEKICAMGHEIVPLKTLLIRDACALAFKMFSMDPAQTAFKHIAASGEPTIPALATTALPHPTMPYEYADLTLEALYDLNEQRNHLKEEFRLLFLQEKVDAIIMPGYQATAPPHDQYGFPPYTVLWNVMDVSISILKKCDVVLNFQSTQAVSFRMEKRIREPMRNSFVAATMNLHVSSIQPSFTLSSFKYVLILRWRSRRCHRRCSVLRAAGWKKYAR